MKSTKSFFNALMVSFLIAGLIVAESSYAVTPIESISVLDVWDGFEMVSSKGAQDRSSAQLKLPGKASFHYQSSVDWRPYHAIDLQVQLLDECRLTLKVELNFDYNQLYRKEGFELIYPKTAYLTVVLTGNDRYRITLPLAQFESESYMPGLEQTAHETSIGDARTSLMLSTKIRAVLSLFSQRPINVMLLAYSHIPGIYDSDSN